MKYEKKEFPARKPKSKGEYLAFVTGYDNGKYTPNRILAYFQPTDNEWYDYEGDKLTQFVTAFLEEEDHTYDIDLAFIRKQCEEFNLHHMDWEDLDSIAADVIQIAENYRKYKEKNSVDERFIQDNYKKT